MVRTIIKINEELCNGCGLCVSACHEAAIVMENGKAKLLRDDYCDGLGNCLPVCPTGAITFEEREALPFNEEEVLANMKKKEISEQKAVTAAQEMPKVFNGCPGTMAKRIQRDVKPVLEATSEKTTSGPSMLNQWPVQIQLVPVNAPYFEDADLLIAADCTAFAFRDFHNFMSGKITIIGCPKLDEVDYSEKLTQILVQNNIKSITVARMEVPCCGGIVNAVKTALMESGNIVPWKVITISTTGNIIEK